MAARGRYSRVALFCCAALLFGCAGGQEPPQVRPGLVRSYSFAVAGKIYNTHRVSGRRNVFAVNTADGGPGNRAAMRKVVRLAFGCHALELTETRPGWRSAEAEGSVCTGGYQRYNRTR